MANISYGVNIIPKTNNAYTLGNSDYKWSNIYTVQLNGTNTSNLLNKDVLLDAGISASTYSTKFNGEFEVTTATSANHTIPYAKASVTGVIDKSKRYRVTVNDTVYILESSIWFASTKYYNYLGNLTKVYDHESWIPGGIVDVPFLITFDRDDESSIEVWTTTAGTYTIKIEAINDTYKRLPLELIYGTSCPNIFSFENSGSTFNGYSIGVNELRNKRGTVGIGHGNALASDFAVAIGLAHTVAGSYSTSVGCNNIIGSTTAIALGGYNITAGSSAYSTILGTSNTVSSGCQSAGALGFRNIINASSRYAHAVGSYNTNDGENSYSFGYYNNSFSDYAMALGIYTNASGKYQLTLGCYNVIDKPTNTWTASTSYVVNDIVFANNRYYKCTTANSDSTFTESKWTRIEGQYLEILGNGTATNARSNARATDWAGNTYIKGDVYVGCNEDSSGGTKLLVSNNPVITGSFSKGRISGTPIGVGSFAFGDDVVAEGPNSIAIGYQTTATGGQSHAEGYQTLVEGIRGFAMGFNVISIYPHEFCIGRYNYYPTINRWVSGTSYSVGDKVKFSGYVLKCKEANSDTGTSPAVSKWDEDYNTLFVIGNGEDGSNRSNALTLKYNGDLYLDGDVYINANASGTSGTKITPLPSVSSPDNGKVLRVVDGAWAAVALPSASGVNF